MSNVLYLDQTDTLSVLISIQTVNKGYQLDKKSQHKQEKEFIYSYSIALLQTCAKLHNIVVFVWGFNIIIINFPSYHTPFMQSPLWIAGYYY